MGETRILVVEGDPKHLRLVRDVLEHCGYDVVGAASGEEAVRLVVDAAPDLVLMDLHLSGIDGTEALRRIRAGQENQDVPVVAVGEFARNEDRDRAFEAGFNGYVATPISVRALPQQVSDHLRLGRGT